MKRLFATLVLATLGSAFIGCSEDEVEDVIDCNDVCERYQDCIDDDYDVGACTDSCEDAADDSDAWRNRLRTCEDCLDDKSCASATFVCTDECAGIVP